MGKGKDSVMTSYPAKTHFCVGTRSLSSRPQTSFPFSSWRGQSPSFRRLFGPPNRNANPQVAFRKPRRANASSLHICVLLPVLCTGISLSPCPLSATPLDASSTTESTLIATRSPQVSITVTSGQPNEPWGATLNLAHRTDGRSVMSCKGVPRLVYRQTLISEGIIKRPEVGIRGRVARIGDCFVAIDDVPALHVVQSGTVKTFQHGHWCMITGVQYYRASIKFTVFKAISDSVNVEVTKVSRKQIMGVKYVGVIEHQFQGTLDVILIPNHRASYGIVTIGGTSSSEEAGDGVVDGNWHAPRSHRNSVLIGRKSIAGAPGDALWSFECYHD